MEENSLSELSSSLDDDENFYFPTELTWSRGWGTENQDVAEDVWADEEGIYVCGSFGENTTQSKLTVRKYVLKARTYGKLIWERNWTSDSATHGKAIWGNGVDIYTAGHYQNALVLIKWDINGTEIWNSTWNLDGNFGKVHSIWGIDQYVYMSGVYIDDLLLIKWDANGIQLWNRTWGGIGWEEGTDVWGNDLGIYTSGSTSSYGNGENDSLIVRWDSDGNQIWNKTWGTTKEDYLTSIFGFDTTIYACGSEWNAETNNTDILIMKVFPNGTRDWYTYYKGYGNDTGHSIWANEYYAYICGSTLREDDEFEDLVWVKYTHTGALIDSFTWGYEGLSDYGKGIFGIDQEIYICGTYYGIYYYQLLLRVYSYDGIQPPVFYTITPNPSQNGSVFIGWNAVPGADSYNLYKDIHPILDISNRTPYQSLTTTNISENGLEEGTYFYVLTTIMANTESIISLPGIVVVNLPDPPKKVPGYNVILVITILGLTSLWIYKKNVRKS
ncbi:MAG: hypothetical protein EU530_07605 [Promethearchaeota archaeon]|nr:MAG: hypothetical protein EU530_07605 [Candidatus Lokiarchaeota archaeon]